MPARPYPLPTMFRRIREAVAPFPKAAMFDLAERGYTTAFQQLVACILSIRTRDEIMLPVAIELFESAATPEATSELSEAELDGRIRAVAFHAAKAAQILAIAREVRDRHGGELPCDPAVLLGFRGVGPKCANLVLGISCGHPVTGVDVHVHRVTNRWGYVATATPEATMHALEERLPPKYRIEINALLVPFGKHVCTGRLPRCSICPVLEYCDQVGVRATR